MIRGDEIFIHCGTCKSDVKNSWRPTLPIFPQRPSSVLLHHCPVSLLLAACRSGQNGGKEVAPSVVGDFGDSYNRLHPKSGNETDRG